MNFWNQVRRLVLWPLALFFSVLVVLRNKFFDKGLFRVKKLSRPVVSIGNISVGGSGKTAVLMTLLQSLHLKNHDKDQTKDQIKDQNFCVLTRGYGVPRVRGFSLYVPQGVNDPKVYSDEPILIRNSTKSEVIINSKRYKGGVFALEKNPGLKAFFLDDGFQHRWLRRDLDIVIFDVHSYFQNSGLMPRGSFREPLSSLKRADVILLSKWQTYPSDQSDQLLQTLKDQYKKPVYKIHSKIQGLKNSQGEDHSGDSQIVLLSAIGNPYIFEEDIKVRFGKDKVIKHFIFPDHYIFKQKEIDAILKFSRESNALVVCTAKDATKIASDKIYIANQRIDLPEALISMVNQVIL